MVYRRYRSRRASRKDRKSKRASRRNRRASRRMRRTGSRRTRRGGSNTNELTITGAFVKRVGRSMPSYDLTPEAVAEVFPTEDGQKSTIGFTLSNGSTEDAAAFDGVHMTGTMITNKDDLEEVQEHAHADEYIGIKVKPVGYTFFGSNCVVLLKPTNATYADKLRELNAVGTPEGQTDERVWHVSVPLKRGSDGKWDKRFDDVSDRKFEFWKGIVTNVPSLVGKSDIELLAIIKGQQQ